MSKRKSSELDSKKSKKKKKDTTVILMITKDDEKTVFPFNYKQGKAKNQKRKNNICYFLYEQGLKVISKKDHLIMS